METKILKEIKQVRDLLSKLVGTYDLPAKERFSTQALDKAALEFKRLSIERGEWISDYELSKVIKKAPHYCGKFIIEKFQFKNYYKHGHRLYFYKKDVVALNEELKKRNINLRQYDELLKDQEKFYKKIEELNSQTGKYEGKIFQIPDGLKDIEKTQIKTPSEDVVISHIASLKEEFQKFKLYEYIDL